MHLMDAANGVTARAIAHGQSSYTSFDELSCESMLVVLVTVDEITVLMWCITVHTYREECSPMHEVIGQLKALDLHPRTAQFLFLFLDKTILALMAYGRSRLGFAFSNIRLTLKVLICITTTVYGRDRTEDLLTNWEIDTSGLHENFEPRTASVRGSFCCTIQHTKLTSPKPFKQHGTHCSIIQFTNLSKVYCGWTVLQPIISQRIKCISLKVESSFSRSISQGPVLILFDRIDHGGNLVCIRPACRCRVDTLDCYLQQVHRSLLACTLGYK